MSECLVIGGEWRWWTIGSGGRDVGWRVGRVRIGRVLAGWMAPGGGGGMGVWVRCGCAQPVSDSPASASAVSHKAIAIPASQPASQSAKAHPGRLRVEFRLRLRLQAARLRRERRRGWEPKGARECRRAQDRSGLVQDSPGHSGYGGKQPAGSSHSSSPRRSSLLSRPPHPSHHT